jgi:D-ribose pyranose/furanose isomerase RbsD
MCDWEEILAERLPALGHRNWIVVADAAYPMQTAPGIETVVTGEEHLTVLQTVLQAITDAPHVRPLIYLDTELQYVSERAAPGVDDLWAEMEVALTGSTVELAPHEEIIEMLDEAGQQFTILLLKTTLTIPYTSVFIRLDCGYWSAEAESKMRRDMEASVGR